MKLTFTLRPSNALEVSKDLGGVFYKFLAVRENTRRQWLQTLCLVYGDDASAKPEIHADGSLTVTLDIPDEDVMDIKRQCKDALVEVI